MGDGANLNTQKWQAFVSPKPPQGNHNAMVFGHEQHFDAYPHAHACMQYPDIGFAYSHEGDESPFPLSGIAGRTAVSTDGVQGFGDSRA